MDRSPTPCYLSQIPIVQFPRVAEEIDFRPVAPPDQHGTYTALWIGSGNTNSGLHFDKLDNYFGQAYGRKVALLASPDQTPFLYPYRYNFAKSRVDPERPDLAAFPDLGKVTFMEAVIEPGELLFIPKLWWHYLRALEPSISINHFFGQFASLRDLAGVLNMCGTGHWLTFVKDFLWHGVLGRPFATRLLSEHPTGEQAWVLVKGAWNRRIHGTKRAVTY
jgi:lysine-specific demethylase 8